MSHKDYKNYYKEKQELIKKYPSNLFAKPNVGPKPEDYPQKDKDTWRRWCKDILDLLLEPNGNFQKFSWDAMAEVDKQQMERRARGRKNKTDIFYD